jgi:spore maturation protein CgeB
VLVRILSIVRKGYYGSKVAVEPMYLYFTAPLQAMGHEVDTFDHYLAGSTHGKATASEMMADRIRSGDFDLVFYQTAGREPVDTSVLAELSRKPCIAAWNSDDDWQWQMTSQLALHFTFMVTTYPHIYEQHRSSCTNLLLSQWGCLGIYSDFDRPKNIEFSFAGAVYGVRNHACRFLTRHAGLECFGRGSRLAALGLPYFRGAFRFPWLSGTALHFKKINEIWNQSRISYTPLAGGPNGEVLSIKSRTFDMGLSGTLMLCEPSPHLERYYVAGKECVTFDSLEDCADKARWYLAHEEERARIATAYRERTLKEHLWQERFVSLFRQMGCY